MFSYKNTYFIALLYIFNIKHHVLSTTLPIHIETDAKQQNFTTKTNLVKNDTAITLKQFNNFITELTKSDPTNTTSFVNLINRAIDEISSNETVTKAVKVNRAEQFEDYIKQLEEERRGFDEAFQGDKSITFTNYLKSRVGDLSQKLNKSLFYDSESGENFEAVDDSELWVPNYRRIFRGRRTKIKHFPFMASVHMFGRFTCAGSIIKSDLVITASSCLQLAWNNRFFRENPKFLSVRVGSSFYIGGGEAIPVFEVYFYPNYDPKTLKHNLAIMRLTRHIKFNKDNRNKVKMIAVDKHDNQLPMKTDGVLILGWGYRTRSNKNYGPWIDRLSYSNLDFYDLSSCQDVYSSKYVTNKHFCAGFMSVGGGACNRDVGGPGVVDGALVGVVSFGAPVCGTRDAPTVFTKLGYYADWIEDIMNQNVPYKKKSTTLKTPWTWRTMTYPTTRRTFAPITRKPSDDDGDDGPGWTDEFNATVPTSAERTGERTKNISNEDGFYEYKDTDDEKPKQTVETTMKTSLIDTTTPTKSTTSWKSTIMIQDEDDDMAYTYLRLANGDSEYHSDDANLRGRESPKEFLNLEIKPDSPQETKVGDDNSTKEIFDETLNVLKAFEKILDNNEQYSDSKTYEGLSIESFEFKLTPWKARTKPPSTLVPELDKTFDSEYDSVS